MRGRKRRLSTGDHSRSKANRHRSSIKELFKGREITGEDPELNQRELIAHTGLDRLDTRSKKNRSSLESAGYDMLSGRFDEEQFPPPFPPVSSTS